MDNILLADQLQPLDHKIPIFVLSGTAITVHNKLPCWWSIVQLFYVHSADFITSSSVSASHKFLLQESIHGRACCNSNDNIFFL